MHTPLQIRYHASVPFPVRLFSANLQRLRHKTASPIMVYVIGKGSRLFTYYIWVSIQVMPDIEEGFTRAANDGHRHILLTRAANDGHRHILLLAHNNALYATGSLYLTPTYISLSEIPIQQSGYTIIISYTRKKCCDAVA